jgi:hypothetical protein
MHIYMYYTDSVTPIDGSTESKLRKIWGFHGGDDEEWCLLGCYAVWRVLELTFRRNFGSYKSHTA